MSLRRIKVKERWRQFTTVCRVSWKVSDFCGVEILTYCIMSNHFHLLVRVPEKQEVSDHELLRRFFGLYGEEKVSIASLTAMLKKDGSEAKAWREADVGAYGGCIDIHEDAQAALFDLV